MLLGSVNASGVCKAVGMKCIEEEDSDVLLFV